MELCADIPTFLWYLHDFHQVGIGVDTYAFHALGLVLLLIFVVELVAMAMTLFYKRFLAIGLVGLATLYSSHS